VIWLRLIIVAEMVDGLSRERQLLLPVEPKESGSFFSLLYLRIPINLNF
jgi:hypothetical protein